MSYHTRVFIPTQNFKSDSVVIWTNLFLRFQFKEKYFEYTVFLNDDILQDIQWFSNDVSKQNIWKFSHFWNGLFIWRYMCENWSSIYKAEGLVKSATRIIWYLQKDLNFIKHTLELPKITPASLIDRQCLFFFAPILAALFMNGLLP